MIKNGMPVIGCGAVTPLGFSAPSTCAALRAQLSAYTASGLFHQSFDPGLGGPLEPIVEAVVPAVDSIDRFSEPARLVQLAAIAVHEALGTLDPAECALIVGVREPHRTHPAFDNLRHGWIDGIEESLGARFHSESSTIARGHVSAFIGLLQARRLLDEGRVAACIVGGVDTLCNVYDLERYVASYRILGPTVSKGFIPGEGAVFVTVASRIAPPAMCWPVCVAGIGLAEEDTENDLLSAGPPTGRGLERALEAALADSGLAESRIDLRLSDVNGESYRIDDALLASIRFYKTYRRHLEFWHPASGVGDIGAASGALLVVQGCTAIARGLAPGAVAMCESASDTIDRAGCVLAHLPLPLV